MCIFLGEGIQRVLVLVVYFQGVVMSNYFQHRKNNLFYSETRFHAVMSWGSYG